MNDPSTDKHKILPLMATCNDGNVPSLWEHPFIMVSTLQPLKDEALQERGGIVSPLEHWLLVLPI